MAYSSQGNDWNVNGRDRHATVLAPILLPWEEVASGQKQLCSDLILLYSPHLHNPPDTSHRSISPTLITLGGGWEPQFVWHPSIFIKLEWTPSTSKNTQPSDRRKYLLWLRSSIIVYLCFWIVYFWPLQMFPIFWPCCAMDSVWMTGAPKYGDCSQNVCPSPPQP